MPKINLPENSIHVMITLNPDDGSMTLSSQGNIPDDLDPEYVKAMMDISNGLCMILENGVEYLATTGSILTALEEEMSEEVVFEPDDELLDAVSDAKIIDFSKKVH